MDSWPVTSDDDDVTVGSGGGGMQGRRVREALGGGIPGGRAGGRTDGAWAWCEAAFKCRPGVAYEMTLRQLSTGQDE